MHDVGMRVKPEAEFEELYRHDAERLWRGLYAYTGDRDLASDAVSEAFTQCLQRAAEIQSLRAWTWRAAFRIAGGEMKRRRTMVQLESEPDRSYLVPEPLWELLAALAKLSRKQRAAVILHYYGGYTAKEIASIIGSSSATVRVHLSQGRKRLRQLLEEESDE
jgi:RNA polymerase sigma-70 factor, ECF subfamily